MAFRNRGRSHYIATVLTQSINGKNLDRQRFWFGCRGRDSGRWRYNHLTLDSRASTGGVDREVVVDTLNRFGDTQQIHKAVTTVSATSGQTGRSGFIFKLGVEVLVRGAGFNHARGFGRGERADPAHVRIGDCAGNDAAVKRNGLLLGDVKNRTVKRRYLGGAACGSDDHVTFKNLVADRKAAHLAFGIAGEHFALGGTDDTNLLSSHDHLQSEKWVYGAIPVLLSLNSDGGMSIGLKGRSR